MGYTTDFTGQFQLSKELTLSQFNELNEFAEVDHRNNPEMPGNYCQWVPTKDGKALKWDGNEKFYDYEERLQHLVDKLKDLSIEVSGSVQYQGEEVGDSGTLLVKNGKAIKREVDLSGITISFSEDEVLELLEGLEGEYEELAAKIRKAAEGE